MRSCLVLLALLCASYAATATPPAPGPSHAVGQALAPASVHEIQQAVARAMTWLDANQADVHADEVVEVVEEMLFYYALSMLTATASTRESYHRAVIKRHADVVAFNRASAGERPHLQGIWGPLTYPPVAHIAVRVGADNSTHLRVIDDMVVAHPYLYPPRDAMQLWIAIYMDRLGYTPATPVDVLLERSPLRQDPQTHVLLDYLADDRNATENRQATIQLVYDFTHQILAVTDFGALSPPAAMLAQSEHYASVFDHAILWAIRADALDILAELLFCAQLLELPDLPSMPHAIAFIIRSQQADGSFGATNPDRRNSRRHGVLTSVLGLTSMSVRMQH